MPEGAGIRTGRVGSTFMVKGSIQSGGGSGAKMRQSVIYKMLSATVL